MTPQEFISKWQRANLSERSACQQHFLDLCDLLGQPKPAEADPEGAWYTFERGVRKTVGGKGWADVWMRGHFGWEYKGKRKNLDLAYQQLLLYREDLENPPLLVVCDLDRFQIHTNFTGTAKKVHAFDLAALAEPQNLDLLRKLFTEPETLKPGQTTESITRQAAERFGLLADGMRVRGVEAPAAAHFLMKLMFCMFGEDIRLLPEKLFSRVLTGSRNDPPKLAQRLGSLFEAMATGGDFGADEIIWFNGGLFSDGDVVKLKPAEIEELILVNDYDWANVEPSIFGTLFERTLDPAKRSQIGAHYTSRQDIVTLLEPVVMTPLRREWHEVRDKCDKLWKKVKKSPPKSTTRRRATPKAVRDFERPLLDFIERLAHVKVLDPACGSGNFLYVAINLLLDLEKEVIAYGANHDVSIIPHVRPTQLAGLEINPYAQQLAQVVIWIGYLQWMHHNGFNPPRNPVLEPIESIHQIDAILDLSDPENPKEPEWPKADFIVGNPPFLGTKMLRGGLGDNYVKRLFQLYSGRIPGFSDLCCYWFEKARAAVAVNPTTIVGLLATQAIRNEASRTVLERILDTGNIFFAYSDREWVLDGAAVHISMVAFSGKKRSGAVLDGSDVAKINANLTSGADTTLAEVLTDSKAIGFVGDVKGGPFDISYAQAMELGNQPAPNGRPTFDVIRPYTNGLDITRRLRDKWVIDFGSTMTIDEAAGFGAPFEHVVKHVKPMRESGRPSRKEWWLHMRPCPAMREAITPLQRYLATPTLTKHRLFVWMSGPTLPDHQLVVFSRSDDYCLGVLHCRVQELWARALGTQLRERESGFRYTPTTCLETFPFPNPTKKQESAIADDARELDQLRSNWLNPPEWTTEQVLEFPGSVDGPWARYVQEPDKRGIGTVRYPRLVARDEESAKQLKKRTLTNLYNQRPTWLDLAHRKLDEAVFAAYRWDRHISGEEILEKLLKLNLQRAAKNP